MNCTKPILLQLKQYLSTSQNNANLMNILTKLAEQQSDNNNNVEETEEKLFNYYCSKIYEETIKFSQVSNIHRLPKDLFIEQCNS